MSKKPFSETKFAKFVKEKVAPVAGDVLGIIGDVTGIEAIEKVGDLINARKEESAEAMALHVEFEKYKLEWQLEVQRIELEELRLEVDDRKSAREMRNEFTRQGKIDWEHFIINMLGIGTFIFIVGWLLMRHIPIENRELVIHLLGIVEGITLSIYAFHNGTTKGSRNKDQLLAQKNAKN
jgi:hypothetical protein